MAPAGTTRKSSSVVTWWVIAAVAQLAGDASLFMASRTVRDNFAWLDVRLTHPVPDSLRRTASRYLRDSLGVVATRQGDTLVVRLPPEAERSVTATIEGLRSSSRGVLTWVLVAFVLLHVPLVLAIVVTISTRISAERERNRALDAWE